MTELTILIIITSASLLTSLISPLVIGVVELSKRLSKSDCCGGSMTFKEKELKKELSEHKINLDNQNVQLNELINLLKKNNNE
jgi:hypothetical protein